MRTGILAVLILGLVVGCGGGNDAGTAAARGDGDGGAAAPAADKASRAPHAEAVARTVDYSSDTLETVERRYTDGVALRVGDERVAVLSLAPLDACTRLAVLARGDSGFGAFASEASPVLVLVRNTEYPQGSVQLVQPGVSVTLANEIVGLETGSQRFVARGEQAGYDPSEPPLVTYDVDLPYAGMDAFDPVAADASPEAAWLRAKAAEADADAEGAVAGSFLENEDDWNSYGSRMAWHDVLVNWDDFSVAAVASGPDCATLLVRAPGFAGGARVALLRASGAGDARKVFFAESRDEHDDGGRFVVGRVEHPAMGSFPIVDARAEWSDGSGPVAIFSERPIGTASWEELVKTQRAVRAVASSPVGDGYMLRSLEFAGPGVDVQSVAADTISNAYRDEASMAGLIRQGEAGQPRLVANFRLPLEPRAATP